MEKRGFGLLLTTVTVAWVTVGTLFVRPVFAYPTCVGGFIVRAAGYSYASCADAEGQCTSVALDVAQQHCAPCSMRPFTQRLRSTPMPRRASRCGLSAPPPPRRLHAVSPTAPST